MMKIYINFGWVFVNINVNQLTFNKIYTIIFSISFRFYITEQ